MTSYILLLIRFVIKIVNDLQMFVFSNPAHQTFFAQESNRFLLSSEGRESFCRRMLSTKRPLQNIFVCQTSFAERFRLVLVVRVREEIFVDCLKCVISNVFCVYWNCEVIELLLSLGRRPCDASQSHRCLEFF